MIMAFTSLFRRLLQVSYLIFVISVLAEQQDPSCANGTEMQVISHIDWPGNDADHRTWIDQVTCEQLCLYNCSCTVAIYANLSNGEHCWMKAIPLGSSIRDDTRIAFVKVFNAVPAMHPIVKKEGKVLMVTGIILMICSLVFAATSLLISLCICRPKLRSMEKDFKVGMKTFTYQETEIETGGSNQSRRGAPGKL